MNPYDDLIAAASPDLQAWMKANWQQVQARINNATAQNRAQASRWFRLADAWRDEYEKESGEKFRARDYAGKPDYIEEIARDVIYPSITETHKARLERMGVPWSLDVALPYLIAWFNQQIDKQPEGVNIWTDAPPDYDHGYTFRTKDTYVWGVSGKTLTRVIIPAESVPWQVRRYESGLHVAFDDERMEKERKYDAAHAFRKLHADEVRRLSTVAQASAELIPAVQYEYGWKIGSKHGYPQPEPRKAILALETAQRDFGRLPAEIKGEEWKLENSLDELFRLAVRAKENADAEAERQEQEQSELRVKLEEAHKASGPGMVLTKLENWKRGADVVKVYGRVLSVPDGYLAKYGQIKTETDPISVFDYLKYPFKAETDTQGIPAEVWSAGAPIDVKPVTAENGKTYYGWRPRASWEYRVVDINGRSVAKGSRLRESLEASLRRAGR